MSCNACPDWRVNERQGGTLEWFFSAVGTGMFSQTGSQQEGQPVTHTAHKGLCASVETLMVAEVRDLPKTFDRTKKEKQKLERQQRSGDS